MKEVLKPNDRPVTKPLDSRPGTRYPPKNNIDDNVLKKTIAPSVVIIDKVFIFIFPFGMIFLLRKIFQ